MKWTRQILLSVVAACSLVDASFAASNLTLTGRYEYRTDSESREMLGDVVCFFPSHESATLLPRPKSDKRLAWFCFRDLSKSKMFLGIPAQPGKAGCGRHGNATVTVTDYDVYRGEGDGFDTAVLQSVVRRSDSTVLPCN